MNAVKQLLAIMSPVRTVMFAAVLLSFCAVASNTLLLATAAYLIAAAALHPPLAALGTAIAAVRFFGLSRAVCRYGERYFSHKATFQILSTIRAWFYAQIEPLAPGKLLSVKSGELLSRIVADVDILQFFYLKVIAPPFAALFILIFGAWWLFSFGNSLVIILMTAFLIAGGVIPFFFGQKARKLADEKLSSRYSLQNNCVDTLSGLAELASFDNTEWQLNKLNKAGIFYENHNRRFNILNAQCESLKNLVLNGSLIALLFAAVHLAWAGAFDKVWLAVIVIAAEGCFEAAGPLSFLKYSLDEALLSWRSLTDIASGRAPAQKEKSLVPANFDLKVSDLSFSYENSGQEILTNISFELKEGSHLAIVGASGAGKSTLVNLLCRFFDYSRGRIDFGGHELRRYDADDLRGYLAVVSQADYLFHASVRDNILLAKPSATPAEFQAALFDAGLGEFLADEALLAKPGSFLSGGERQRVALARAFLKNAPLLILDEPTASLDKTTARQLMASIYQLTQNRSSILITHDFSLLGNVDEIILLSQGSIRERGTLASLLAQNGLFAKMYALQKDLLKWP